MMSNMSKRIKGTWYDDISLLCENWMVGFSSGFQKMTMTVYVLCDAIHYVVFDMEIWMEIIDVASHVCI